MNSVTKALRTFGTFGFAMLLLPSQTWAQHYKQKNVISDLAGMAPLQDTHLVNPWGLTRSPGSPWWVANNNSGTSTLYGIDTNGNAFKAPPPPDGPLVVTVPPPEDAAPKTQSTPTGIVFNGSPTDFLLSPGNPAFFIFATEDGTISGWNPAIDPFHAILKVDNSDGGSAVGAVYKGATTADINGHRFLYVTNFRSARVEVYDTHFNSVSFGFDAFDDATIPAGFAPFNVQNIGGSLFVTYAKQDAALHDPVSGDGFGFVDIYTPSGKLISRLEHGDWFNAPWGVVWTPRDFGEFSNTLLVGNFRSGWIAAFNGFTHKFLDFVKNPDGSLVTIDGVWSLTFGNNGAAGPSTTLFFTAGIQNETHGLFGTLTPVDAEQDGDEE